MAKLNYHNRVERILLRDSIRRKKRDVIPCSEPALTFYDVKGELFEINVLIPEFQKALNSSDFLEAKRICQLMGRRLNSIYLSIKLKS